MHKFHPYIMQILQRLREDNSDRRREFCEIMSNPVNAIPNLLTNIYFSDECSFFLNGNINKQNCRYWSDENPHIFQEGHTQNPYKVKVWADIPGTAIIGSLFIQENLTDYLNMFQEIIHPLITYELKTQIDAESNIILQEDKSFLSSRPTMIKLQISG